MRGTRVVDSRSQLDIDVAGLHCVRNNVARKTLPGDIAVRAGITAIGARLASVAQAKVRGKADKPRIVLALPFTVIGGADTILTSIFHELAKDFDVIVVTSLVAPASCGDTTALYEQFASDVVHLPIRFTSERARRDFLMKEASHPDTVALFIVGCEFAYHLLPHIKTRRPDLIVFDQLFNEIGHIANNRRYGGFIDLNIVANTCVRDVLLQTYGEDPAKVRVIIHGVDVNTRYNPTKVAALEVRPTEGQSLRISYLGRFSEEKGPDLFVDIVREMHRRGITELSPVMTGNGPEFGNVQEQIRQYGLEGKIDTPGFVAEVVPYLLNTDVVVLPSRIDGLPIVILEALALGVPVVAARVGGIPSIITEGATGLLCDAGDIPGFANALSRLHQDRPLLEQMKRNAREFAVNQISEAKMHTQYREAITKTLAMRPQA